MNLSRNICSGKCCLIDDIQRVEISSLKVAVKISDVEMPACCMKKKIPFFLLLSCKAQLRIIQCCYITSTRNTRSRLCFFHVHITQFSRFSSLLHLSLIFLFGAQTKKEKNEENIHFILFPVREKRRNRFCVEESASTKEIRRERERERQVLLHTRGD